MKTVASMGLPACTVFPSTSKFRVKHFQGQPCQPQRSLRLRARRQTSPTCSMKASMAEFGEPKKVNMQISILREKLWEAIPDTVKEIPWKKAEKTLMERLLFVGQKALKWTLIVLFVFSSLSDVIFSISSNQELMIPLGLFVGCLMTDFLKEISHELFRNSEEKRLNWQFMGIGCFFVLIKFLSANFLIRSKVFLLHFANGGLMQLFVAVEKAYQKRGKINRENYLNGRRSSLAGDDCI